MTEKKIDQFFTPVRNFKRLKPSESSGSDGSVEMGSEKVGELTRGELMEGIGQLMEGLLDKKLSSLATKADLAELTGKVEALTVENEALKVEIHALKIQEKTVMAKLLDLEGRSRRNNLVFRGLKWSSNKTDFCFLIKSFCDDMFGSSGTIYVNRAHPLGRDGNAIIAHFPSDCDIDYIMSRVKQLKGTGYTVHRDYPQEIRDKRARLAAVRAEVERVSGRRRMALVFDHLNIEGRQFYWEKDRLMAGRLDGAKELQVITKCDFSEFLERLAREGPKRNQQQRGYAGATASGLTRTPPTDNRSLEASNTTTGAAC